MCEICGKTPCFTRCPNERQEAVYVCDKCGDEIFEGDKYIEGVCEYCIENMTVNELLDFLGYSYDIAEFESYC